MGKGPLAVFLAVLAVGAVTALSYLTDPREAIVSTPSAFTGLTKPLTLPAHGEVCADEILFDTEMRVARIGATTVAGMPAPEIEVVAQAVPAGTTPYRSDYRATSRVAGGWTGARTLDVPLAPPAKDTFGTFCVRNLSSGALDLVGTEDGRAFARPAVKVNGDPTPLELQLRFLEDGRKSLLSRPGEITSHASASKPFGAWWMWVLALALVAAAPFAVAGAIRSGLVADGTLTDDRPAPMGAWSPGRLWARVKILPGWVLLGAGLLAAVVWFFYWSINTHVFQNDEDQYVYLSRWLWRDFPQSLWNFDIYGRGLQRLEIWLLALPGLVTDSPWSLALGRLLNTLAFVSTAIPVYLLGRGLGLRSRWAALPAVLSAVIPWAVVTTAFLTENIAYPAFAWVLYTTWRAANRPSAWGDVLALLAILIAGLSRSALLALAPLLPLTVLVTSWRVGGLRTVLREHVVLWGAIALAVVAVVPGMLGVGPTSGLSSKVAGGYGTPWNANLWGLVEKSGRYLSRTVIGTGFFAAAVGVPWLFVQLVRSRDRATFAFAFAAIVSAVLLFYTLSTAGADERYIVYLAPLVLLPATAALARGDLTPVLLGVGSVLAALLVLRVPWNGEQGAFGFFIWPVETFYGRTVGIKLGRILPGDTNDALLLFGLGLGLLGVVLAVVLARRPRWLAGPAAAIIVGAVALTIPVQTQYSLSKHVNGVGSKSAPGLKDRAFADRLTPGGKTVGELAAGVGQNGVFFGIWQEVQFYNQRIETVFALNANVNPVPIGDELVDQVGFDPDTGRISSPKPLTDYMVVPTPPEGPHLRGDVVIAPAYIPAALIKVAKPASMAWRASGFGLDGRVSQAGGGAIRIYGSGCATLDLAAPPDRDVTYRVDQGAEQGVAKGSLAAGEAGSATVQVSGEHTDLSLFGGAQLRNVRTDCA